MYAENLIYYGAYLRKQIPFAEKQHFKNVTVCLFYKELRSCVIVAPVLTAERKIFVKRLIRRKDKFNRENRKQKKSFSPSAICHCVKSG